MLIIAEVIAMSSYIGIKGATAALLFAKNVGCASALNYQVKWLSINRMQL